MEIKLKNLLIHQLELQDYLGFLIKWVRLKRIKKTLRTVFHFLDETVFAMESVQSEVMNIVGKLTEIQNPINQGNLDVYADI